MADWPKHVVYREIPTSRATVNRELHVGTHQVNTRQTKQNMTKALELAVAILKHHCPVGDNPGLGDLRIAPVVIEDLDSFTVMEAWSPHMSIGVTAANQLDSVFVPTSLARQLLSTGQGGDSLITPEWILENVPTSDEAVRTKYEKELKTLSEECDQLSV